jgi:hypothetical protein
MLTQAGHRLVVSPWFAAGAGVVIATGVMIYTPHTNFAIDIQKCQLVSCTNLTPQGGPPPVPVGTGAPMPAPSKASLPKGMTFSYQVLSQSTQYGFNMLITIHSPDNFGPWRLSFVIPGTRDLFVVYGASWRSSGVDGGTASSYFAGTESAGYAMIAAHDAGNDGGSSPSGYTVVFQIRGSGTPSPPTHGTYNGAPCTFKPSPDPTQPVGQGSS